METRYWVIGGDYADTTCRQFIDGTQAERLGPFSCYDDARNAWKKRAWETVDTCTRRYHIQEEPHPASSPQAVN